MSNVINNSAFLRTSRDFSKSTIDDLCIDINKSYIDTALAVNNRTIGLYPTNRSSVTGNAYYVAKNQRQQTLRQVYTFTGTSAINHGITDAASVRFINCFGSYINGVNTYGLFFASSVAIAGQITFYVTSTQIIFNVGSGAPSLTNGIIVLEWISQT